MKKFKYLDLPQYLFINMISYCCKQKFLYRFFIINMTRNISETNVINCYWMKLCNMLKILTCLVCCVNCICHVLHTKKKQPYTATPSNILQRTPFTQCVQRNIPTKFAIRANVPLVSEKKVFFLIFSQDQLNFTTYFVQYFFFFKYLLGYQVVPKFNQQIVERQY